MVVEIYTPQTLLSLVENSNLQPSIPIIEAGNPFARRALKNRRLRKISSYEDAQKFFNRSLNLAAKVLNISPFTPGEFNFLLQNLVNQHSLVKKYAPASLMAAA